MIDATVHFSSGRAALFPINELMERPSVRFSGSGGKYSLTIEDTEYEVTYLFCDYSGEYVILVPEDAHNLTKALVREFTAFEVPMVSIRGGVVYIW